MNNHEILKNIVQLSHDYGSDKEFVLAGGGNTSCKDDVHLYVKASGTSLKTISEEGFVKMERPKLAKIWSKTYPEDDKVREAEVLNDLMNARAPSEGSKRPSVEVLLHDLFPQRYVVHTHPAVINGVTCSNRGQKAIEELFGDSVVWVEEIKPGYSLAVRVKAMMDEYRARHGKPADILFLQNHGVFIAADTPDDIKFKTEGIVTRIKERLSEVPDFSKVDFDTEAVNVISTMIQDIFANYGSKAYIVFSVNKAIQDFIADETAFSDLAQPFSPDHMVYCRSEFIFAPHSSTLHELAGAVKNYEQRNQCLPKVIAIEKLGVFTLGETANDAQTAADLFEDAVKIAVYSRSFGGPRHMSEELVKFISAWEVESYRKKVSLAEGGAKA